MVYICDFENNVKFSDVEECCMVIYCDLFFNNVDGFVSFVYLVFKSLYLE